MEKWWGIWVNLVDSGVEITLLNKFVFKVKLYDPEVSVEGVMRKTLYIVETQTAVLGILNHNIKDCLGDKHFKANRSNY